ncbi:immune inhibitor A domain-containing protein [Methanobacterium petrolearium]|uniref:immune inhibitor A domain-containing protein n=1 Tax=Methanobacterium petrolearium TaxID=710190 RepID=UPI0030815683
MMCSAYATEMPTDEQIAQYQADGTLDERIANVTAIGDQYTDSGLVDNLNQKLNNITNDSNETLEPSASRPTSTSLPSTGTVKMLIMLVDFPDYPHNENQTVTEIESIYFGDGSQAHDTSINYYPYESLHNWYYMSSYGLLNITGDVVGWYTAQYNRSYYTDKMVLMMEVMSYYDSTVDFSQYDNNHDGYMEGVALKWTGPNEGWGSQWWSYAVSTDSDFTVDGVKLKKYMWAWYSSSPKTDIHETGHLLGLPDLYDYEVSSGGNVNGPGYGVGGLDMMSGGLVISIVSLNYFLDG